MATRTAHARSFAAAIRPIGSDRDLLREFVHDRSHAAFAELVRRYAPLVFGVCRRALNHTHDAEDAFQATFLVLARRANRISAPEKLPGWLHAVAVRTATEVRHMRDRRQAIPVNPCRQGGNASADSAEQHELAAALDVELAKLPDHYRLPVVLCELRGLSRKQAAAELGIAEGTLSSRLAKARKLLADRLTKRGFTASVTGVSAALTATAFARVPESLASAVVEFAVNSTGDAVAATVSAVSDTVVKALFATKLKSVVLASGLLLTLAGGLLLVPGGAGAQPGDGPGTKVKAAPAEPLVRQLGSKDFAEREAAEKELRKLGPKATAALKVGLKSDAPEVVERASKVLASIRQDDVDRFVKAFRADTEYKQPFDHPIWTRWAKTVGDDRGSRELFAEMLSVKDAALVLNDLSDGGAANAELYRNEVTKWQAVVKKRTETPVNGHNYQEHQSHLIGEAAFVVYMATFAGTEMAFKAEYSSGEVWSLLAMTDFPLVRPGVEWKPRYGRSDPMPKHEQAACDRMKPAVNKLLVASLFPRTNPWTMVLGTQSYDGDPSDLLSLAKAVCRDKDRSTALRATVLPLLARNVEADYLPDMVALQGDRTQVQNFVERNGIGANFILVCDVAIASQLLMHKQDLKEYGFPKVIERSTGYILKDGWQCNPGLHGFTNKADRVTTHEKALAFLKSAPKPEPKKDPEAEALVRQLGSKDFAEREAAEKELRKLRAKAFDAVKAGVKSEVPEVAERCARLLPSLRVQHMIATDHPVWKRFSEVAGATTEAEKLYADMVGDDRRAEVLEAVTAKPDTAGAVYKDELNRGIKALREGYDEAERRNRGMTGINHPDSGIPTRGELVALLFLGTFPKTADTTPDVEVDWRDGLHANLFGYGLAPPRGERRELPEPVRKLLVEWLAVRRDPQMIQEGFSQVKQHGVTEALPVARAVAADKTYATKERAAALLVVGLFGDAVDVKLAEPLFDCADEFHSTNYTYQGRKQVRLITQVRDAAYGVAMKLLGEEPADHGYEVCIEYKARGMTPLHTPWHFGFRSEDNRTAAHAKVKAFLKAPVPKAKPVLPKKLDKMPDPSPELWKELHLFDENYRHGTAEKFAELEKKADELAKQFPDKDDQACIWYEVAHVTAQSDIRKHTERVKKYAPKCLEISRDPLHRAWMYSYLASVEEVSDGAFADRRRKAADWLLTGYLELLAQELPDEKPELPAVGKIDSKDPQELAKHAAQMAARGQAVFARDQVFRRDVLVQQLRGLYKPNPNQANRDEKGLDELKALAAKKLPDDAAVKMLVERVLK